MLAFLCTPYRIRDSRDHKLYLLLFSDSLTPTGAIKKTALGKMAVKNALICEVSARKPFNCIDIISLAILLVFSLF